MAGSTRLSMQVTMYRFRFGMNGSRSMSWRALGSRAKARLRSRSGAMFDTAWPFAVNDGVMLAGLRERWSALPPCCGGER
jgi:hypothetical protein